MNLFEFYRDFAVLLEKHGLEATNFRVTRHPPNRILGKLARTEIIVEVPA